MMKEKIKHHIVCVCLCDTQARRERKRKRLMKQLWSTFFQAGRLSIFC